MRKLLLETEYLNLALIDNEYVIYRSEEGTARNCFCGHCYDANHPEEHTVEYELEHLDINSRLVIKESTVEKAVLKLLNDANNDKLRSFSVFNHTKVESVFDKFIPFIQNSIEVKLEAIEVFGLDKTNSLFWKLNY